MNRLFRIYRWIMGLLPTLLIIICVSVLGGLAYVSIIGLPDNVKSMLERELARQEVPVSIGKLTISLFPTISLVATDVKTQDTFFIGEGTIHTKKMTIELDRDALLDGDFIFTRLQFIDGSLQTDLSEPESAHPVLLNITDIQATLESTSSSHLTITSFTSKLHGIHVTITGVIPLKTETPSEQEKPTEIPRQDLAQVIQVIDQLKWLNKYPPSLKLHFARGQDDAMTTRAEISAPQLSYNSATVNSLQAIIEYKKDTVILQDLQFTQPQQAGNFTLSAQLHIPTCTLSGKVNSSLPILTLFHKINAASLEQISDLKIDGKCHIVSTFSLRWNKEWKTLQSVKAWGSTEITSFSIDSTNTFKGFKADFSWDNGAFYLADFAIIHEEGELHGSAMGKDSKLLFDINSNLAARFILAFAQNTLGEQIVLPMGIILKGTPHIVAKGSILFEDNDWTKFQSIESIACTAKSGPLHIAGIELETIDLDVTATPDSYVLNSCQIILDADARGVFTATGTKTGNELTFEAKNCLISSAGISILEPEFAVPVQTIMQLCGQSDVISDDVKKYITTLPEHIAFNIKGHITLPHEKEDKAPTSLAINSLVFQAKTDSFACKKVPFSSLEIEGEINKNTLSISNLALTHAGGTLQARVEGALDGDLQIAGNTTLPLLAAFPLMLGEDDDVDAFAKRFELTNQSSLDATFSITLNTADIGNTFDLTVEPAHAQNTSYMGVDILEARCKITYNAQASVLVFYSPFIVFNNEAFITAKENLGHGINQSAKKSSLTARKVDLHFGKVQLVWVEEMSGYVFPSYALQMFSPKVAKILKPLIVTDPVLIKGNGKFPLTGDISKMQGLLTFQMNKGEARYHLLNTTMRLSGNVSGIIRIDPKWVIIDKVEGTLWSGRFRGNLSASIDDKNDLNANLFLDGASLTEIGKSYKADLGAATINTQFSFKSQGGKANTIKGSGYAEMHSTGLVNLPLLGQVGNLLNKVIPLLDNFTTLGVSDASGNFDVADGFLTTSNIATSGTNLTSTGSGKLNIDTLDTDITLQMKLQGLPAVLSLPTFMLGERLFTVQGKGKLQDINWAVSPYAKHASPSDTKKEGSNMIMRGVNGVLNIFK